jgi:hypothetical protein
MENDHLADRQRADEAAFVGRGLPDSLVPERILGSGGSSVVLLCRRNAAAGPRGVAPALTTLPGTLPGEVATKARRGRPPSTTAAAASVDPVVATSSISTQPSSAGHRNAQLGADRTGPRRPACRGHHHPGRRAATDGIPVWRATSRANEVAGSTPCRHARSRARGTGTIPVAVPGIRVAMARPRKAAASGEPEYLSWWTRACAAPS